MHRRLCRALAVLALASGLAACQGTGSIQLANPLPALQSYIQALQNSMSPKDAVQSTASNPTVQQQAAPDLVPYRSEFDATVNAWIVYYYSPSKGKSYRCTPKADKTVTVSEVTDSNLVYQQGDTLDVNQVNVNASAAAQAAVTAAATGGGGGTSPSPAASPSPSPSAAASASPSAAASESPAASASPVASGSPATTASASPAASASPSASPSAAPSATASAATGGGTTNVTNVNVTNVNVTNVTLISSGEFERRHGRRVGHPVYVVVTTTQTVYVDASTGTTITTTQTTTTTTTTAS